MPKTTPRAPVSAQPSITLIDQPDVILIGGGIMSAHLGTMLKGLEPRLRIQLFEVTDGLAEENSNGWNNAGTGHAGLCEVSYTPQREADGSVNVSKAIAIFEQFERSKQFWSHTIASGMVQNPADFIHAVPHFGFVRGQEDVAFLRARYSAMAPHHFFKPMKYTNDGPTIAAWAPLVMDGRGEEPVAATKIDAGTEVNFGTLARRLLGWLAQQEGCGIACGHRVLPVFAGPLADGRSASGIWGPVSSACIKRSFCSWGRAGVVCLCCKRQASRRHAGWVVSLLVVSGWCATIQKSSPAITAKFTAWCLMLRPVWAVHISISAGLTAGIICSSVPSLRGPRSFSPDRPP